MNFSKIGSSQKTLRPRWCPKLVTGLAFRLICCCLQHDFICELWSAHQVRGQWLGVTQQL